MLAVAAASLYAAVTAYFERAPVKSPAQGSTPLRMNGQRSRSYVSIRFSSAS
jgi:hypothetical protein